MKNPLQQAERWFRQAEHDLQVARMDLANGFYSDCCFMSEQIGQKVVKAFLMRQGERTVLEHSIRSLVKHASHYESAFQSLLEGAGMLDQYYIPTRYPDALAEPAVPFESYTQEQATKALAMAQQMLEFVRHRLQ